MKTGHRFKCPACGFTVFNRRISTCEACNAALPATLSFSEKELAFLTEEALRIESARRALADEADRLEREKQRRRGDGGW